MLSEGFLSAAAALIASLLVKSPRPFLHIRERQREGISLARKGQRQPGRAKALTAEQAQAIRELAAKDTDKKAPASAFGITRQTLYRYL